MRQLNYVTKNGILTPPDDQNPILEALKGVGRVMQKFREEHPNVDINSLTDKELEALVEKDKKQNPETAKRIEEMAKQQDESEKLNRESALVS